ncbi:MAG: MFS transporter, partial [Verrucomicrobia bacterium]|nr:MFS transporter [Verrucomicrobiota bacterium]
LALGTGVGAAVLDDGVPLRVDGDSPGHLGQIDVSLDDRAPIGPDGGAGSLEGYLGVPAIRRELHATFSQVELIIAGYGLSYAVWLITGGRLGDIFGRRRTFILGMAGFTLTSALCGSAPNAYVLVGWRVLQGSSAALMFPQALSYIHVTFAGAEKRLAFSLYGAMIGLGSITGQILGGFLIQANLWGLTWRPIFLINLPLGLITILAARALLAESRAKHAPALDPIGMAIITGALALFSVALLEGREAGWPAWAWVCLLASAPLFVVFYRFERHEALRGRTPLLQPRLFADRGFVVGMVVTCIYFAGHTSMLLMLSLYLQLSLGLSPLYAGLALVPFSFGFVVGSTASGKVNGLLGRNALHLGVSVLTLSLIALLLEVRAAPAHETFGFACTCFCYGIGRGLVTAPLYNTVLSEVPLIDAGAASGLVSTMQQVANSVGIALIGAVVFSVIPKHPAPADYSHGFLVTTVINLGMLGLASCLIFYIPKRRGQDRPSNAAEPVAEG